MIRYGIVRPTGLGPDTKLERGRFAVCRGNLAKHWLEGVFDGREKIADLFVVDESTLFSGPKSKLWKLAALIWNEDWKVIDQRHVEGGRMWIFQLQRGSEKISFSVLLTTTFLVNEADILPLEPEVFQTSTLQKEQQLSAMKLARQLNPSIDTEEGKLKCRLEQIEGEIELLSEEKIATIGAIARCGVVSPR